METQRKTNRNNRKKEGERILRRREISQGLEEFSVIYICRFWSPQIPTLIKRNQLKLSSFNVYLN